MAYQEDDFKNNEYNSQKGLGDLSDLFKKENNESSGFNAGSYVNAAQGLYQGSQDIQRTSDFNVNEYLGDDPNYNENYHPGSFQEQAVPDEISKGTGNRAALQYGAQYAATGAQIGGLWGGVIGGAVGVGVGALKGSEAKAKRKEFEEKQRQRRVSYDEAVRSFHMNVGEQNLNKGIRRSTQNRRQNNTPLYNSSLYGLM